MDIKMEVAMEMATRSGKSTRKQRLQSSDCKELNSANKLNELGSGFVCRATRWEFSFTDTGSVRL